MVAPNYNRWRIPGIIGTETGAFFFSAGIRGPGFQGTITPIVNTAAERSIISHNDAIRLGIPANVLQRAVTPVASMSGKAQTFIVNEVVLSFSAQGMLIELPTIPLTVVRYILDDLDEEQKNMALSRPSCIGRSTLNLFEEFLYSARNNRLELIFLERPRY